MIGIDITTISRFQESTFLSNFLKKFNVDGNDPTAAAKTWACLESVVKAEGKSFDYSKIKIVFPKNSPPLLLDTEKILTGKYVLTLSHESDTVVAVAFRESNYIN